MSDDILGRIAGWCLADPKLTFVEEGPAIEVAGEPPVRLDLALGAEEVLLSHHLTPSGAGPDAPAQATALVNRRGSLLRGTAEEGEGGLAVKVEYPVYLDGLTRQNFVLATQEMAAAIDALHALGPAGAAAAGPEPEPAPEPEVVIEPAAAALPADTIEMPTPPLTVSAFAPTHEVPAGGMPAWADPDPSLQPVARLEARVQLRVDERRGAWARVTGSNGWTGWVDDRRLLPLGGAPAAAAAPAPAAPATVPAAAPAPVTAPLPAVWAATHQVPASGMAAWAGPDPSLPPSAQLAGRVQLRVEETRGAWARVSGENGWTGWVDARLLEPAGRRAGGGGGIALGGLTLRPLPLIGGILLVVATFLSWLKALQVFGNPTANGWDVGLPIIWTINNPGDQPRIGLILLIVGIVGLGAAFIPKIGRGLAALSGLLAAVIGGLYVFQVTRLWGQEGFWPWCPGTGACPGAGTGDILSDAIGIGPWLALGGALLLLVGALLPDRKS